MTDPARTASGVLHASAAALLAATASISTGPYAWVPAAVADGLQVAGDLLTAEPEQVRTVLSHGLRNVLDRLPGLAAQDSRDIAKGIAGVYGAIRGWMA